VGDIYQVNFGALVRVGVVEEVAPARLNQVARHFDVVVGEIQQEHLEAVQGISARVQAELGQLADEAYNLHFRLDINLILVNCKGYSIKFSLYSVQMFTAITKRPGGGVTLSIISVISIIN